jgi:hypothetical protein
MHHYYLLRRECWHPSERLRIAYWRQAGLLPYGGLKTALADTLGRDVEMPAAKCVGALPH